ncbi:tetratricopeptide repeat protein [Streptomyces melanogenes]|uniref:tetratricopeptide repeat protein n=1 Tax=Streptomyces melanogenes TaxID=67326 RepID=UPI0019C4F5CD|nr:tetratricopeptide repeat protein [Streptomyces melanogenes]GGP82258.1 tetratricopeptide repeat protein [Streptomyces melanogenes]
MTRWFTRRRANGDKTPAPGAASPSQAQTSGDRSVAIGGNSHASILTGDNARVVNLPPEALRPMAEVDAPDGLDNLPYRKDLVGRAADLDALNQALTRPGQAVVQAVHGLGGVGKSALAIHWAATRGRQQGLAPTRWITADSPESLQQGLAGLATALQPGLSQVLPVEDLAECAVQWLATHSGWLLVLDNVTRPADIAELLARATTGRYLITSRLSTGWHDAATRIRLDVLDQAEALTLLTSRAGAAGSRDMDGAAELCEELGHLPLALEQAAAYLAQTPLLTPRGYLGLLAAYPAEMFDVGGAEVTASDATIARVWRVTLDRIAEQQPLATNLLRILAWYAPDHIPTMLLDGAGSPAAVHRSLGLLTAYSMATADPSTDTLSVHRLVQALSRTPDSPATDVTGHHDPDPHRRPHLINQARDEATNLLSDFLTSTWDDPVHWPAGRILLPHANALVDHAPAAHDTVTTMEVLNSTGLFLAGQGMNVRAIRHFDRAASSGRRVLGDDHPKTLAASSNLANAYRSVGDLGRAIRLHEQSLADSVRVLGDDHPDTLNSRNNLAGAYQEVGDLGRAIPLYEQTLRDRQRVLGDDHPDTLSSRNNLAGAYQEVGDLGRAIPLDEQTLADSVRVLGDDHPRTLTSRNNLAYAYQAVGDLGRAIPLYEQTLRDRQRVLGDDHPNTLAASSNLANAYRAVGDLGRAIPLYEQALADSVRVLGNDHPQALAARSGLAKSYQAVGDLRRAIPLYEQTLRDGQRVLGDDHPNTLAASNNLANAYRAVGDLGRAIPLYEQALADSVRVLGNDHPQALTSRSNLANAYRAAGDLRRAIPLYEQALADSVRVLGNDHPDTGASRDDLADARQALANLGPGDSAGSKP